MQGKLDNFFEEWELFTLAKIKMAKNANYLQMGKNIAIGYGNFFDICNVYVLVLTFNHC